MPQGEGRILWAVCLSLLPFELVSGPQIKKPSASIVLNAEEAQMQSERPGPKKIQGSLSSHNRGRFFLKVMQVKINTAVYKLAHREMNQ